MLTVAAHHTGAVIYLGELLGMLWLTRPAGGAPSNGEQSRHPRHGYRAGSNAFVSANLAQAAWCAAFRPWALHTLWLPTLLLATAASCLYVSQVREGWVGGGEGLTSNSG